MRHSFRRRIAGSAALLLVATIFSAPSSAEVSPGVSGEFTAAFQPFDTLPPPPAAAPATILGTGLASWYGGDFAGRRTASGERFNPQELTAAHRSLPFGSMVLVTHIDSGRSVVVRINDRGPFTRGRVIDVSEAAARRIGLIGAGHGEVSLALVP
jgi:rare lipoprotein A